MENNYYGDFNFKLKKRVNKMGAQCTTPQSAPWYAYFFMDPGIKWCRMRIGNLAYMHAVPWIAIAMLLARSFMER